MGFIGYRRIDDRVRVFLECAEGASLECAEGASLDSTENEDSAALSCTYPVDVVFTAAGARLEGVRDIFALKKFYKLVNSLEERAREQNRDRTVVFRSPEDLLAHLRLTRNARELSEDPPSRIS